MTNAAILEDMTTADFFDTMGKRIRILRDDKRLNQTQLTQRMAGFLCLPIITNSNIGA